MNNTIVMPPEISPEQYVLAKLVKHPTLYAADSYENAARHIFDQLFNVIGNGIRDDEELMSELAETEIVEESFAQKYLTGEPLYWGYEQVRELCSGVFVPENSAESVVALESEKHLYPSVKLWVQSNKRFSDKTETQRVPYPNFDEKYSLIYKTNFKELGEEWIDAAIWFYEDAKKWFETKSKYYHYAYPSHSERKDQSLIDSFTEKFQKYSDNDSISKDYGVEFHGDIDDFARRRWQKELTRINTFIDNSIQMLKSWKQQVTSEN